MEDNRNALFVEPGAYIQHHVNKTEEKKKIVFQEPYESLPKYYPNHDLKSSGKCECVHKNEHKKSEPKRSCFDIKSLLPLLGSFGGGGNNISNILSSIGGGDIFKTLLSNPDLIGSVSKMFFKPKMSEKKEDCTIKQSDIEIRNYTRVE